MHTSIPSQGLKRCWHWCPRRVNTGNKNTPSMHHPRRRNVTTSMVGLESGHIRKNLTENGAPQRYSWERRRIRGNSVWWHTTEFQFLTPVLIILTSISVTGLWGSQKFSDFSFMMFSFQFFSDYCWNILVCWNSLFVMCVTWSKETTSFL